MLNQIIQGDCYELMKDIPDGSIDLVLTDPPYNTTACEWDQQPIDLPELWKHIKRILKPKGAVVMTGSQPFTTDLICSNRKWFRLEMIWLKSNGGGFLNANRQPLKRHENILIFSENQFTYNPQKVMGKPYACRRASAGISTFDQSVAGWVTNNIGDRYPVSYHYYPNDTGLHPTQKPITLFEYLIKTYTNPGETVLDPFAGSGTTAIAAHNTGRNFICFEKETKYVEIANKRLALAQSQLRFEEMVG